MNLTGQKNRKTCRTVFAGSVARWLIVPLLGWTPLLSANWVAYNDHAPGPRTHAYTTRYHVFGNGSPVAGAMRNIATGAVLPVTLSISRTATGVASASAADNPAAGTPLDVLFGEYVDFAGSPESSVELTGNGAVTYTFSGLDPEETYSFRGSVVRGDVAYTTRWTLCEIVGARSAAPAHSSPRVLTTVLVPALGGNQAAFNSGVNHTLDTGDYVGWDEILPAVNGSFAVVCRQYTGTVPGGSSGGSKGYALTGVRLEEAPCGTPLPLSIISAPQSRAAIEGAPVVFNVAVSGCPAYFQWFKDGVPLAGEDQPSYWITTTSTNDTGDYFVVVSNAVSSVTSPIIRLTVYPDLSVPLIPLHHSWRYDQSGANQGTDWTKPGFDDSGWPGGRAVLAHEDNPMVTPLIQTFLSLVSPAQNPIITYYFRTHFNLTNAPADVTLLFSNLIDDGAVIWLNGTELYRVSMDPVPVTATTLAQNAAEGVFAVTNVLATNLLAGDNVLAVEVHQTATTSSDVVFGLTLSAVPRQTGPAVVGQYPHHQVANVGEDISFHVETAGQPPLSCQWQFNGRDLPGQTNPVLTLPEIAMSRQGFYSLRVQNEFGPAYALPDRLTVHDPTMVPFYTARFDSGAGPEWSVPRTDVTPVGGRRFLGQFGTEAVTLNLSGLPAHRVVTVKFDLFVIRSWDGNASAGIGPDQWRLGVPGGVLLHSTFSNWRTVVQRLVQCYPDRYHGTANPSFYGADEEYTLGYQHAGEPMDAVYRITRSFSHASGSLQLSFAGLNLQDITDESWGIDNVSVYLSDFEPLRFASPARTNGLFAGRLLGLDHRESVVLETSTNLNLDSWTTIRASTPGELYLDFAEPLTNQSLRVYRAVSP